MTDESTTNFDLVLQEEAPIGVRFIFTGDRIKLFSFMLSYTEIEELAIHLTKMIKTKNLREAKEYIDGQKNRLENRETVSEGLDSSPQKS